MANYDDWNRAISLAYTRGAPSGTPVYLAVDAEALESIAETSFSASVPPPEGWSVDFQHAVRERVVQGGAVQLSRIRGRPDDLDEPPDSVAFLAATVLAASRMADDAVISELNYFLRLREVLGVDVDAGGQSTRPVGLSTGAEESFWQSWNRWLSRTDLLATADRGPEGPRKYINYPLSQALLREADRQHLNDVFERHAPSVPLYCDPQTLAAIVGEPRWPTSHLREIMGQDAARRVAAQDAVFEAFELWKAQLTSVGFSSKGNRPLMAGLFREEDPITAKVAYRLFPRMRRGSDVLARPTLEQEGETYRLRPMRQGWYEPTGRVSEQALADGVREPLEGLARVDAIELPQRPFWMLVPEPEDPGSGLFASWGPPRLGEPFILLAQESLTRDLQLLRDAGLVDWEGDPRCTVPGWVELHGFLAVSEAWDGVYTENAQIYQELRPRAALSISVFGGLRSPSGGWLEGCGPQVVVHGFEGHGRIIVRANTGDSSTYEVPFAVNQSVEGLNWNRVGAFRIEAENSGERSDARLVRIDSWDGLIRRAPAEPLRTNISGASIEGAWMVSP